MKKLQLVIFLQTAIIAVMLLGGCAGPTVDGVGRWLACV